MWWECNYNDEMSSVWDNNYHAIGDVCVVLKVGIAYHAKQRVINWFWKGFSCRKQVLHTLKQCFSLNLFDQSTTITVLWRWVGDVLPMIIMVMWSIMMNDVWIIMQR